MSKIKKNDTPPHETIKKSEEAIEKTKKPKKSSKHNLEDLKKSLLFCAHDLSEPLRIIASFLHILFTKRQSSWDQEEKKYFDIVIRNLTYLNLFTHDILLQSHLDRQNTYSILSLENVIQEIQDFFSLICRIENIVFVIPNKLPKVLGSFVAVQHVFLNLIDNIIKHSRLRPLYIFINHKILHDMVYISISDHRKYIPHDLMGIKLDSDERDERYKTILSHGIGLSLCKALIQQQGGKLTVKKDQSGLFEVVFSLPVAKDENQ